MCTPCRDCVADMCSHLKNTFVMYTPACPGAQETCLVHSTLTAKMHVHPRKHARATAQQCLHPANRCDLSCNLSSAQETAKFHNSLCRSSSCVAAQASSDPTSWCRPHPVCLSFTFNHGRRGDYPAQNSISTIFAVFFFVYVGVCVRLRTHAHKLHVG